MNKKAIRDASIVDLFTEKKGQYEDYGFVLQWDELGDDLQNEKIVDYAKYNKTEYPGAEDMEDDDIISNTEWYEDIVYHISRHFPMYF